jgi:manganese efflux pump family protein
VLAAAIRIILIATSLALDVFAVSVGVGVRGASKRAKIRIGVAFASAEIIMNCAGAALGLVAGRLIGDAAGYIGFVALLLVGIYMIVEARRDLGDRAPVDVTSGWGLFVAALSISLDSLGIGFSVLYIGVPLPVSLSVIGAVSIAATALGLALGRALGLRIGDAAELLGGALIALTGALFIILKALQLG